MFSHRNAVVAAFHAVMGYRPDYSIAVMNLSNGNILDDAPNDWQLVIDAISESDAQVGIVFFTNRIVGMRLSKVFRSALGDQVAYMLTCDNSVIFDEHGSPEDIYEPGYDWLRHRC